jgi:hypothetical protein
MRPFFMAFIFAGVIALAPQANAAPGAVRCGKLLDVRSGKLLTDQVIVFDAAGVVTSVGPAGSPLAARDCRRPLKWYVYTRLD